jgi:ornithine carbamoyltransferase
MRHFLSFEDFSKEEILEIIELSKKIKAELKNGVKIPYLDRQVLGMIFEKSSTRTRVSFETGIYQLGGHGMFLSSRDIQLGRGEPIRDTANVISSMVDMIMLRTFGHDKLEDLAKYSKVPVINGLTDLCHPVQILADYLTIIEEGIENPIIAYVGDGNNMTNSFLLFSAKMGFEIRVATPEKYAVNSEIIEKAQKFAKESGAKIILTSSPKEAVSGSNVVVTDTWISMGMENEKEQRISDFKGFIVDKELFSHSSENSIFLHCLPAYRGYEVSEDVIDGEKSRIYREAENRLHAQKGLMVWLSNSKS